MKLKFCSEGDCPLWALAALHALGSLPSPLFRALLQNVLEEQEKDDNVMEILENTSLCSRDECARALAVIRWVLQQSWRNASSGAQLTRDLLMLGVPRAHATLLADAAAANQDAYNATVQNNHFTVRRLTNVTASAGPEGAVDTITLHLFSDDHTGENRKNELLIDKSLALILLEQLKRARHEMNMIQ